MRKDERAAFLRWIDTADNQELQLSLVRLVALIETTLTEEGALDDARALVRWIKSELEARRSIR
ncbi:MAG: hypothetical protein WAM94_01850 [Chromatiaceae bacterium]